MKKGTWKSFLTLLLALSLVLGLAVTSYADAEDETAAVYDEEEEEEEETEDETTEGTTDSADDSSSADSSEDEEEETEGESSVLSEGDEVTSEGEYAVTLSFDEDYYMLHTYIIFTPDVSGTYYIFTSGDYDSYLEVYSMDSDGYDEDLLDEDDDSGADYNALMTVDLTAGTSYKIYLGCYEYEDEDGDGIYDDVTLSITLTTDESLVDTTDSWDPSIDDAVASNTVVSADNSYSGAFSESSPYVYYSFTPSEDGTYYFYTTSDLDTYAILMDASGEIVSSDDDSGVESNAFLECELTAGTTYYICITSWSHRYGYDDDISYDDDSVFTLTVQKEEDAVHLYKGVWYTLSDGVLTFYVEGTEDWSVAYDVNDKMSNIADQVTELVIGDYIYYVSDYLLAELYNLESITVSGTNTYTESYSYSGDDYSFSDDIVISLYVGSDGALYAYEYYAYSYEDSEDSESGVSEGVYLVWVPNDVTSFIILSDVTYICDNAFANCDSLTSVYFEGDYSEYIDISSFYSLKNATIYYPSNNDTWTDEAITALQEIIDYLNEEYGNNLSLASYVKTETTTSATSASESTSTTAVDTSDSFGMSGYAALLLAAVCAVLFLMKKRAR